MKFLDYLTLIRRHLVFIIGVALILGVALYAITLRSPRVFEAHATIAIGPALNNRNPDRADLQAGIDLAETYAQLVKTNDILQSTIDVLNLDMDVEALSRTFRARILPRTSLLVLEVTYGDQEVVADIANQLAQQLVLKGPSNLTPEQQLQLDFANQQIETLGTRVQDASIQLTDLDEQLQVTRDELGRTTLLNQRNVLNNQINQMLATIADFSDIVARLSQNTNVLEIVESATVPDQHSGTRPVIMGVLGGFVGIVISVIAVLAKDYFNVSIRNLAEAKQALGMPILGAVEPFGGFRRGYARRLFGELRPDSPILNSYRSIQAKLFLTADPDTQHCFVITSPNPGEGASLTAANLAATIAASGIRTLLVDANLYAPTLHQIFEFETKDGLREFLQSDMDEWLDHQETLAKVDAKGIEKQAGISVTTVNRVLISSENVSENVRHRVQQSLQIEKYLHNTTIKTLSVMGSHATSDLLQLIGSNRLNQSFIECWHAAGFDVIIFDTPAALQWSDSTILAAKLNAKVIMVMEAYRTRERDVKTVCEQMRDIGIGIQGGILNKARPGF